VVLALGTQMSLCRPHLDPAHFRDKGTEWWTREYDSPHDAFVFRHLRESEVVNILEIGPGRGVYALRLANLRKHVTAIDINRDFITFCKHRENRVEFVRGNGELLPFRANAFDAVVCVEVLMHIQHPVRLFGEVSRVLRPQGIALVSYLRKFSSYHWKTLFSLLTGIYARRYGQDAFDYRFDSLLSIRSWSSTAGLETTFVNGTNTANPCVLLEKRARFDV
jgi:ubiquinone/menaquinone biosynthesis C-methylase UbiE